MKQPSLSGKSSQPKQSKRLKSRRSMHALESRVVYDGAVAATVDHALPAATPPRDVVFVDTAVKDWQTLAKAAKPGAQVVLLDPTKGNEMDQIAAALKGETGVASISILSHGNSGMLKLGNSIVDTANLSAYGNDLQAIKSALGPNGDILLYGCDVGAGAAGRSFIDTLAHDTGAVVAASTNLTGAGSDWNLEISTGTVDAASALDTSALANYHYDLATIQVTTNADSGAGSLRNAISSATAGDTITFNGNMTITLASSLTIGKSLTIDGGANTITVDGAYKYTDFSITAGTVTLRNLTVTHGAVAGTGGQGGSVYTAGGNAFGGGINNAGTLELDGVTVTANAATGGGGGGYSYIGGGGGGGSGFTSSGAGAAGGYAKYSTKTYAAGSVSGSTGGNGGGFAGYYGKGGSISGGGNGATGTGYATGGNGATATDGTYTIGGGGGGEGGAGGKAGKVGGSAAGGIYNSGTLYVIGSSSITHNLAAGGGGAGAGGVGNHGAYGGRGVGGIWNAATGTVHITSTIYTAMSSGKNYGVSGAIGGVYNGASNSTASANNPAGVNKIYNAGGTLDKTYVAPPTVNSSMSLSTDSGSNTTDWITNTGSQTITGSLSAVLAANDKVRYSLDAGSTWTDLTTQPTGTSWSTGSITMSGSSTFEAQVYNSVSGVSTTESTHTYTIDTTAPAAPTLALGTDTGYSTTDKITSNGTVNVSGLETNSTWQYSTDGGTNWTAGSGTSFTLTTDNTYSLAVKQTDLAGNTSANGTASVTLDKTAPALSTATVNGNQLVLTYTEAGSGIYGSYVPATTDYSVTDAGSSDAVTGVSVNASAKTVTLTLTSAVSAGDAVTMSYTPNATVSKDLQDVAGNTAASLSSQAVTNNTVAAPGTPTLTTATDTGSSSSDGITSNTKPTFTGTGVTGDTVYLYDGSTQIGSATVASGAWSITPGTALTEGSHSITAKQSPDSGTTLSAASGTESVTIDTTAPTASVTATTVNNSTNVTTVQSTETGTAYLVKSTDTVTDLASLNTLAGGNTANSVTISAASTNTTISTSGLVDGTYHVYTVDAAGNVSSASSAAVILDSTAPTAPTTAIALTAASDTGSSNSDGITSDTSPTMRVSLSGTGAVAGDSVELLLGGASLAHATTATLTSTNITNGYVDMAVTTGDLGSDGSKTFTAQVTDVAGNVGTAGGSKTITLDTTAPSTTISGIGISADTGTSSTDFITKTASQTISGTLSTNLAAGEFLYGSTDGGSTWTDVTSKASGTSISWTGATLVTGSSKSIEFKVTDTAGNNGTAASQAYTLDTTAPTTTISSIGISADSGTSSTDFITKTTSQTIGGTLSAGLAGGEILYGSTDGGTTWTDVTSKISGTTITWNNATLQSGTSSIEFKVTDTAGNDGTIASQAYTLDATAPTVTNSTFSVAENSAATAFSSSDLLLSDVEAASKLTYTVGTLPSKGTLSLNGTALTAGGTFTQADVNSGLLTFKPTSGVTGSDSFTFTASDAAGNASASQTATLNITVPTTTTTTRTYDTSTNTSPPPPTGTSEGSSMETSEGSSMETSEGSSTGTPVTQAVHANSAQQQSALNMDTGSDQSGDQGSGGHRANATQSSSDHSAEGVEHFSPGESFQLGVADLFPTRLNTTMTFDAHQANGNPLPGWLHFDSATGVFSGKMPSGDVELHIQVRATDSEGHTMDVNFTITDKGKGGDAERGSAPALHGHALLAALGIPEIGLPAHSGVHEAHGHDSGRHTAVSEQRHAPGLSAQLRSEANRFEHSRNSVLHHVGKVAEARRAAVNA